ncbi:MAG: methyltransferase domain-containing protein [Bryobacteraceae bacterium]
MRIALIALVVGLPCLGQQFGATENLAPNLPTPELIVHKMLEAGHVKPGETVYDLGSGDGRILIAAAKEFGARGVGIEILPELCSKSRQRIKELGLDAQITIIEGSALRADLRQADVVTMCLLTGSNERLRPILEKSLRPGSRVVTNEFPVKGWRPFAVAHVRDGSMEHIIYVYSMGNTK